MLRPAPPIASAMTLVAMLCLVSRSVFASPSRARALRPIWAASTSEPAANPIGSLPATLTTDPAPDPLDANWVGMPLPTFYPLVAPTGYVEFQGRQIYAGMFKSAGAIAAPSIAAWDGTSFSPMGNPAMWAQSLIVWNDALYAAGQDLQGHGFVSRWDGSSWTPVGTATGGASNLPVMQCLEVFDGDLVVAGDFFAMDGVPALRVARFDGASWHAMGAGLASKPNFDLQAVGSDLYVGSFNGIRRWDGSGWVDVGPGLQGGPVSALTTDGTSLYAAGAFSKAGVDSVPG